VTTRSTRETLMLEALARIARVTKNPCSDDCTVSLCVAARALATVKALDDAVMAARGPGSAGGEVAGG